MLAGPRVLRVLQPFQVLRPECASRRSPELFASTFLLKPVQSNLCGIVFSPSLPRKNRLSAIGITDPPLHLPISDGAILSAAAELWPKGG